MTLCRFGSQNAIAPFVPPSGGGERPVASRASRPHRAQRTTEGFI